MVNTRSEESQSFFDFVVGSSLRYDLGRLQQLPPNWQAYAIGLWR